MIAPYKWLCDYVDMDIEPEALMRKLIMTGSAVDGYKELGVGLEKVVVGRIDSIKKHPDADKLSVCEVFDGQETLQIVCGASNIYEGALVPVALVGASLPSGLKITKGKLRGVFSFGMLCSGEELGLSESDYPGADADGIMLLSGSPAPGTPLREVLGLYDTVFDIEVGANRPDCLSMLGVARECAASLEAPFKMPGRDFTENGGSIHDFIKVQVRDADLCERYIARAVKNVRIEASPKWLADKLMSAGVRSINNIVDITNFVMLETGQPMHAFDYHDIRGGEIIVRRAQAEETITTLDNKERVLNPEMLLICDAQGPIGIAGVMGGENSEIKNDTATVIFESAKFRQGNVRRTARTLGLQTESAMRFSKGIDAAGCKTAMDRALHLVQLLGAGEIVSGEIDVLSADLSPKKVRVPAEKINTVLGTDISAEAMAMLLRRVFLPTVIEGGTLVCDIPSFRGDISCGEDIAEEVARMHGYDNIPMAKMTGEVVRGGIMDDERCIDKVRALLCALGCYECVTYSFGSMADMQKLGDESLLCAVRILNPLGEDQAYMRMTPVPDMLKVVANNINKKAQDIRLFETGRVYLPAKEEGKLPTERKYVCIAFCGHEDFFTLKGAVENICDAFGIKDTAYRKEASPFYHPGRKASAYAQGGRLGEFGEIAPDTAAAFGISRRVYVAVLWIDVLLGAADDTRRYETLPRFPSVERDIALIVDAQVPSSSLLACIRENGGAYLESVSFFDVYTGGQLGEGKKSLAYKIVFRANSRTLLDEEANAARDTIVSAAAGRFGAKLRE